MKFPNWPSFKGYRNIDFGLDRVYDLLERLGDPHKKITPTIHIAGTNGKGSTLAFLQGIFEEKGLLVHKYISPHLVNFNERIILAGKEISDKFLDEVSLECQKAAEIEPKIDVTFFEGITVMAFLAFSKVKADILLLETGMGGRLDATNVLDEVLCSIITPISFDHQEFLGNNLSDIAKEKCGIFKKDCPVICGKQEPEALEMIKKQAKKLNCDLKVFNEDWKIDQEEKKWGYIGKLSMKLKYPNLIGNHQVDNLSLALSAIFEAPLHKSMLAISPDKINKAITKINWPGRLQKIEPLPILNSKLAVSNAFSECYIDGSHNIAGAKILKGFLQSQGKKKRVVIFAMLKDKDCEGFLTEISGEIDELIAIEIPNESNSIPKDKIVKIAQKNNIKAQSANNFEDAFSKIKDDSMILICGSLYLVGSYTNTILT